MSEWVAPLSHALLEDRVDRGCTPDAAAAAAVDYSRWLEQLTSSRHERSTCPDEPMIRSWRAELGFHTGQSTVIVAKQGAGKSYAAAYLIQKALEHRPEWDIYSNLPFPWDTDLRGVVPSPPNLHPIASMSSLLRGISKTILADRIPAAVVDEADQAATSHSWSRDSDESWTKFLYVERHYRLRGPILVYHFYQHVPLPLRPQGALRGSYLRLTVSGSRRRFACVEDPSSWFVVGRTVLPYYNLGLRGFDLDVDMEDLEDLLDGGLKDVARQTIAYLDEVDSRRAAEASVDAEGARSAHRTSIAKRDRALADRTGAFEDRNEEIVRLFLRSPKTTNPEVRALFLTDIHGSLLAKLRAEAARRRRAGESGSGE